MVSYYVNVMEERTLDRRDEIESEIWKKAI